MKSSAALNRTWSLVASVCCLIAGVLGFVAGNIAMGAVVIVVSIVFAILAYTASSASA